MDLMWDAGGRNCKHPGQLQHWSVRLSVSGPWGSAGLPGTRPRRWRRSGSKIMTGETPPKRPVVSMYRQTGRQTYYVLWDQNPNISRTKMSLCSDSLLFSLLLVSPEVLKLCYKIKRVLCVLLKNTSIHTNVKKFLLCSWHQAGFSQTLQRLWRIKIQALWLHEGGKSIATNGFFLYLRLKNTCANSHVFVQK